MGPAVEFSVGANDPTLPEGRLMPDTSVARIPIEVSLACPVRLSSLPTEIEFAVVETAPYASVVLDPEKGTVDLGPQRCADLNYRAVFKAEAQVTTRRDAPAMTEFSTQLAALVRDEYGEYGPETGSFSVTNDYLPLTALNPGPLFVKAAPNKRVAFAVDVTNLGNGPTIVSAEIVHPKTAKLPRVEPGDDLHLDSRAVDGAAALFQGTHEIQAWTPKAVGYKNAIFGFHVLYRAAYDGNASGKPLQDVQTMAFSVQVQGVGTPNIGLAASLVAFAAALYLRHRP
jgi:hypothetical protein